MKNSEALLIKKKKYRKKFFNIKDSYSLVKFINKIPNLEQIKFKLSKQQCDVVGENENLIVIGRSGTGKTTCALMRMFSIQILYKDTIARERHYSQGNLERYVCKSKFIDQIYGVKNVFLTASSHLIKEINSKYEELSTHIKFQLDTNLRSKILPLSTKKKPQQQEKQKFGLKQLNNAQKQQKKREAIYNSFHHLQQKNYPGFFTIKEFLIMLDGVLKDTFFKRDQQRARIYNSKDVEIDNEKRMFKIKFRQRQYFAKQCKWDNFVNEFWDKSKVKQIIKMKKKYSKTEFNKQISTILVWTQIMSTIKGQFSSHSYPKRYLPEKKYLQLSKSKSYSQDQKSVIYQIFLAYQQWKQRQRYYDLLDLANHLFANLKYYFQFQNGDHIFFNDQPVEFNYLFLDQVQDSPPVIPYLISQMFTDGLYFSGDSAQAIQKGVAFKFQDIKFMFNEYFPYPPLPFEKPKLHKLTMNFRSHQNILNLANSIIRMIEKLFPKTIDSLNKEQSKLSGPRPIFLNYQCEQSIKWLLLQKGQEKLGSNTAIIVRNSQIKSKLPEPLKRLGGLPLTVEQSKGSQFSNVIMYDFFDPKLSHLWKILKYLDIYPKRGSTVFHINQINIQDYEQLKTQLKLLYTLVTRTKCCLIIYEQKMPIQLEFLWSHLDLINLGNLDEMRQQKDKYYKNVKSLARQTTWQQRGYNYYLNKEFNLALQCYKNAGMEDVCKKIDAILTFEESKKLLKKLRQKYQIQRYQLIYSQQELQNNFHYKKFLQQCKDQIYSQMQRAGQLFQQSLAFQQAANCFYLGNDYKNALKNYLKDASQENYYKIAYCNQKIGNFKDAVKYYKLCQKYAEMVEALEKLNHFDQIILQLKESKDFPGRQMYFRKYSHKVISKKYRAIDKGQKAIQTKIDFKPKGYYEHGQIIEQLDVIFCQQQIKKFQEKMKKFQYQLRSQFRKTGVESQFLSNREGIQGFIKNIKNRQKQIFQKERLQNLSQQFYLWIDQLEANIDQKDKQYLRQAKQNQEKIIQMIKQQDKIIQQAQKKVLNPLINLQNMIKNFIINLREFRQQELVNKDSIKKVISNLLIFDFVKDNKEVTLKPIFEILDNTIQYCLKIEKEFNQYLAQLSQLKDNCFNLHPQQIQTIDNYQITSAQKQISTIFQQLSVIIQKHFFHLTNQQKRKINEACYSRIYNLHYKLPVERILRSEFNDIINRQQNILQQIVLKISLPNTSVFQPENIMRSSQRREQISEEISKRSKFRFLNHITIERQCQIKMRKLKYNINQLQVISPRAILSISLLQNYREKAVQALIGQLSYLSSCYSQHQTQFENQVKKQLPKKVKKNEEFFKLISLINPSYFDFLLYRTQYRLQSAANQLIEGVILLGLHKQFQSIFSFKLNAKIALMDMNIEDIQRINHQIGKVSTTSPNSIKKQQKQSLDDQLRSQILISQYIKMDNYQYDSWYTQQKIDHKKYLTNQQYKEVQKQVKQIVTKQAQNLRFCQKKLVKQISNQIKFQVNDRKALKICIENKQLKKYDTMISQEVPYNQAIQFYTKQIDVYTEIKVQIRKKVYEQINKKYPDIFEVYNKQVNQMLIIFQSCINGSNDFAQKQRQNFNKFKSKLQNLKYAFFERSIEKDLVNLITNQIKVCKTHLQKKQKSFQQQNSISQKLNKLIQVKKGQNELTYMYNQVKKCRDFQTFIKKQKQIEKKLDVLQNWIAGFTQQYNLNKRRIQNKQQLVLPQKILQKVLNKRYNILLAEQKNVNRFIYLLFIQKNEQKILKQFYEVYCSKQNSHQNKIKVLLFYISFKKYKRIQKMIFRQNKTNDQLKDQIEQINSMIENSLYHKMGLQLYLCLLSILRIKYIHNCPFMTIYEGMVLVNKYSFIIQSHKFNSNQFFCYNVDEGGSNFIMKLSQVSQFINKTLKNIVQIDVMPIIEPNQSLVIDLMINNIISSKNDTTVGENRLMTNIQQRKEQLLHFYYRNQFVSHQSCLFVYHQLKAYYDLIIVMRQSKIKRISEQSYVLKNINYLKDQFNRWKQYAQKYEIYKRISRYE